MPGNKVLIMGNHDTMPASKYLELFNNIIGTVRYKKYWLSHFPIHESELYDKTVIHGHTHSKGIADPKYINVSVEMTGGKPINLQDIKGGKFVTHNRVNLPYIDS